MDYPNRLLRITAESIVGKMIRDIKNDTNRSIRKGIDLGSTFAKGELQKEFFELAGEVAASPQNPYNQLIKRGVNTIDDDIFRTVGVNLGMTSFTFGVKQIRAHYVNTGRSRPWLRSYDLSSTGNAIRPDALKLRLDRSVKQGICTFLFLAGSRQESLNPILDAAERHPECTCILVTEPDILSESEAARILSLKNVAVLLSINSPGNSGNTKKAEAFRLLRQYHLLYGFLFYYGADTSADTSAEFLNAMIENGCFFGVYLQTDEKQAEPEHPVYNFVCAARKEGIQPILLFDYRRDIRFIQELILQKRHFTDSHENP